jgi:hypothetical protein
MKVMPVLTGGENINKGNFRDYKKNKKIKKKKVQQALSE